MYDNNLFDIIYHEHKSYPLAFSLQFLFRQNDMCLFDVLATPPHGGSIRCFVSNEFRSSETVDEFIKDETNSGLIVKGDKNIKMANWKKKILGTSKQILDKLKEYKKENKKIICYGAPAKFTTLSYVLGLNKTLIDYVVDDNPLKIGTYTPGTNIPVVSKDKILSSPSDVIVVTAWNFSESIIAQNPEFEGVWLVPLSTANYLVEIKNEKST